MPRKIFLKPAEGVTVFLPTRGRNIFPEGEMVVVDSFVERCMSDGALVAVSEGRQQSKMNTAKTNSKEER
ncbi:MAG: DUF2635 domain-containing protein [Fibrobacter sp.]|nr:DUF2635 domain-containing protein [Fibrobacter sp.]